MSTAPTSSTGVADGPSPARPVIVITGANGGVGFGIAQRLLVQLSSPTPTDTLPNHPSTYASSGRDRRPTASPFAAPDGCTLILACRNAIKAHRARAQLVNLLHYLEDLPDEAGQPLYVPRSVLDQPSEAAKGNVTIDEDADPALVAQAMEASLRRRRKRNAAVSMATAAAAEADGSAGDHSAGRGGLSHAAQQERDLTRDPRTGRTYSMREREIKARGRYRRRFCAGTKIEIQAIDLGSMASALQCAKEITARHRYVTHVILNAGSSAFIGINWFHAAWMMLTSFHAAVTYPAYKLERAGDVGKDGYGWVWQANVGAHYILVRALLPALRATPYSTPSRIIWTGSLEAHENAYDPSDYQCVDAKRSLHPYESAKYQCELAAHGLEEILNGRRIRTEPGTPLLGAVNEEGKSYVDLRVKAGSRASSIYGGRDEIEPKSFLAHPGVVATSIFAECLNAFLSACMHLAFYVARWTFSKHHNIEAYKGAVAASHVALAPLPTLDASARYGSQSDWYGREYVYQGRTPSWNATSANGRNKESKEAKEAILKAAQRNTHHNLPAQPGEYVHALALDLIIKLEGVARKVWNSAQEGALVPFADLLPNDVVAHNHETLANAGRKGNEAAASLSAQLLPQGRAKANGSAVHASAAAGSAVSSGRQQVQTNKEASMSSQEDWEKIEDSL